MITLPDVQPTDKIVVHFSCGAASAVAAWIACDLYPGQVRLLNNPVAEEDQDNRRFLRDVEAWTGVGVEESKNRDFPNASAVEVWAGRRYMSGIKGAPCTMLLKKQARQQWEADNPVDWHVFGFTADEEIRHKRFVLTERPNVLPLLIAFGLDKQACFDICTARGLKLPRIYDVLPNANCIGCVKAKSPTYWNAVREHFPEVFAARAAQARDIGVKLVSVKGKRIQLDELDPKARGRPMKTLKMPECGVICEER